MSDITTILDNLLSQDTPYCLSSAEKALSFKQGLEALTRHHFDNCPGYRNIFTAHGLDISDFTAQQIPALC
ncbi:MAG: hypothetical protein MJK04_24575, partial [Psychrosphaera sp.]|nr:hypothetical protein [Psychrosphaera sp.]